MSLVQEFSSEHTNGLDFTRSNNEFLSTNHPNLQDDKYNSSNEYEDLKLPEVFHRQSNGNFFCKACYITLQGGPNTTNIKHHLTGSSHNFFLQVYKNKSEAAILVTEAMKKGTIKKSSSLKFFCRSCRLSLEYNSLSLLAGHLQLLEHQENAKFKESPSADSYIKPLQTPSLEEMKTTIEVMENDIDELMVISCGFCRAEVPAVNIEMHTISAKHRTNIEKFKVTTNKIDPSFPNVNVMGAEEAIEFGIVKEEDVMSYFCNACYKLLPSDGTMNPLKTHLDSANHMAAACFDREELKNMVKREIANGYLVFKFKANMEEQRNDNNGIDHTYKESHKTFFQAPMSITTLGSTGDRSQQRRNRKKNKGLKHKNKHQQEDKYKNEWSNSHRNNHIISTTNTGTPYKYRPKAPPPPSMSECYENENYINTPSQNLYNNSYRQYSTESDANHFARWDYNQRETSHCMVEGTYEFINSLSHTNPSLRRTEMYGYQNAESEIQPVHIAKRNIERVSAIERNIDRIPSIESNSKDSNEILVTEHPFSPFKAVLILGCLCDDLGLFGETVKAICKNSLDDKDKILQIFKEKEVRMTMKIVADKLRKLAESAPDEPSKEKFMVGLEKVMLLLQYSVDA